MLQESVYAKWIDLPWYCAVSMLTDEKGVYPFDKVKPDSVTLEEVLFALNEPEELVANRQRALALCFAGTEWETDALEKMILNKVRKGPDVFFEVAGACLREKKIVEVMRKALFIHEWESVEEGIFALIPFVSCGEQAVFDLILRVVKKLAWYSLAVVGNEEVYQWLIMFEKKSPYSAELLQLLSRAVTIGISKDSNASASLRRYGMQWVEVCKIAWCVRNKCTVYERGYRKTEAILQQFLEALAVSTRFWKLEEKQLISEYFVGKIPKRICSIQNYGWYYKKFGYEGSEKALSIDFSDSVSIKKRRSILSETDFNLAVLWDGIEDYEPLQLTFQEWHPALEELFHCVKPSEYHRGYVASETELPELVHEFGIESMEVNAAIYHGFDCNNIETFKVVEENYRRRFHPEYVEFLDKAIENFSEEYIEEVLSEDAKIFYQVASRTGSLDVIKKWGIEQIKEVPEDVWEHPFVLDAVMSGCSITSIDSLYDLNRILSVCSEPVEKVVEAFRDLQDMDSWRLYLLARDGQLCNQLKVNNEDTDLIYWLSNSTCGRNFREWTGITVKECVDNLEVAAPILALSNNMLCIQLERYKALLPAVVKEWINTGNPLNALENIRSVQSLGGGNWAKEWLSLMQKKPNDLLLLSGLGINHGWIDEKMCWLTSIGIVSEEPIQAGIPCWIPSEEGEQKQIFVGVALESEFVPWLGKTLHCDTTIEIKLERVG